MIDRVAIHTAPMEVMNQLAAVVVGSMLPLVVNTIRYRNSVMASATVTWGSNSSAITTNPTAV